MVATAPPITVVFKNDRRLPIPVISFFRRLMSQSPLAGCNWQTATNIVMQWDRTCSVGWEVWTNSSLYQECRISLSSLISGARLARGCRNSHWLLDHSGQKILMVLVRVVGIVRKPCAGEEIALPGHGATLHMDVVDEAVLEVWCSPVPAPDHSAALRKLS